MVGKNNQYVKKIKQGTKVEAYSIKKFKVGIASVAIGCSVFFGAGAVAMAGEQPVATGTDAVPTSESVAPKAKIEVTTVETAAVTSRTPVKPQATAEKLIDTVNTTKLETLIKEVEGLNLEKYTEESVKELNVRLSKAKDALVNAKNQKEIDSAYNALVGYKNSGLKRVPKLEENNTPKPDTTGGKETVGKKAENTEPNGTNIAGHNHSLTGTTLPEGSGFRATSDASSFSYELSGADLSSLVAGEELGYGKNVIIKVKYDTNAINRRDIGFTTTPNVGPRLEYTRKASDGIGPYEGGLNLKLMGRIPNDMIGTYDLHLHLLNNKNSNSERATLKIPITVKPKKPTVSVADLEHAEGKMPVVTARVADATVSKAEFYLNNQKQATVEAANGTATWTPTAPLKENDIITVKNIAKGGIPPRDAYGNTFTVREVESDMSDAVKIPKAPTPTLNKDGAKNEVNTAFTNKSDQVNRDTSLTNEEKAEVIGLAETAKNNAIQNIESAQDETALNNAKNNGVTNIGNVTLARTTKKDEAKEAIRQAANTKRGEIDKQAGLTEDEKTTAKQTVTDKETAALSAVDTATTNALVEQAKTNGIGEINKVTATGTKKAEAIRAVEAARTTKDQAIDGNNDLTTEEKTEAKKQTAKAKEDAVNAINTATTDATVETAKTNGIGEINKITAIGTKKDEAKEAIRQAANTKRGEIDKQAGLTEDEKTTAKQTVTEKETAALSAVDTATTNALVEQAKTNGIGEINKVTATGTKKAEAIRAVEAARTTKDQEIDGNNDLTTEEKTEVKKQTEKAKADAVNAINSATTAALVEAAKTNGINAINGVALPVETEKAKAIAEIKAALATKEKATDEDKALTKGQKTSIKEIARKEAMAATVKIKAATTNKDVEEAKNEGIEKIKAAYARNAELAAELTLPELIITKWQDEAGNDLRPADAKVPAEPGGTNKALAHGEIAGYEFVATRNAGEVVTHIFRKLPKKSPIIEERQLPVVENVNTKTVLPNTGANTTNTGLAGLGLAVFGGLLTVARQRRRNK